MGIMPQFDDIRTGDVVLMSSATPMSVIVRWGVFSDYNHSAVAVRIDMQQLPDIKIVRTGGTLCLVEFNGDDYVNLLTGEIHHGNRLVQMDPMIKKYRRIAIRHLHEYHYTESFVMRLRNFIFRYCRHKTDVQLAIPALNSIFAFDMPNDNSDNHPAFCSELSAKLYGDIISNSIQENYKKFLPHHFASNKYNHLFEVDTITVHECISPWTDFLHSKVFFVILFLIIIIVFILFVVLGRKVYVRYVVRK